MRSSNGRMSKESQDISRYPFQVWGERKPLAAITCEIRNVKTLKEQEHGFDIDLLSALEARGEGCVCRSSSYVSGDNLEELQSRPVVWPGSQTLL